MNVQYRQWYSSSNKYLYNSYIKAKCIYGMSVLPEIETPVFYKIHEMPVLKVEIKMITIFMIMPVLLYSRCWNAHFFSILQISVQTNVYVISTKMQAFSMLLILYQVQYILNKVSVNEGSPVFSSSWFPEFLVHEKTIPRLPEAKFATIPLLQKIILILLNSLTLNLWINMEKEKNWAKLPTLPWLYTIHIQPNPT